MSSLTTQQQPTQAITSKGPLGFENFTQEDMLIPRLRLLQALSQAVSDGIGAAGQFQDSLTEEVLGDNVEIVLLGMRNGAAYFEPGQGLVCKSVDGISSIRGDSCKDCPFGQYHREWRDDKAPKCSSTKEFLCVTKDTVAGKSSRPIAVSFMRSSFPIGKKLITMARLTGEDIFANSYVIKSKKEKNDKGVFYKMDVSKGAHLTQEELVKANHWYEVMNNMKVSVLDPEIENISESNVVDEI